MAAVCRGATPTGDEGAGVPPAPSPPRAHRRGSICDRRTQGTGAAASGSRGRTRSRRSLPARSTRPLTGSQRVRDRGWTPWPSSSEIRSPIATAKATIAATPCRVRKSAHPACPSRRNKPSSGQEQLTNIPIHTPVVVWRRLSWTIELVCAKRSQSADRNGVLQIPKRDRRRSTIGTRTVVSAVLPGNISVHTGRPLPSRTAATTICRRSGRWSFEYPCPPASPRRAVERQCRGVHEHQRQIAEDPATLWRLDMQLIEIE